LVGGTIGVIAGVSGGWFDNLLMRVMDAILAFPPLILAMAVTVGLGVGVRTAAIGIMITSVPFYARLLRSEALRVRTLPFVEAAAALGATRLRIIMRHVVPHLMSTLLIQAAAVFGYAILSLAALGFVGLGAQVPTPEWGTMITDGLQYTLTGQWWIGVFPGIGLLAAVTATSLIADRARDILDPRGQYAHA
jgi:peptide/nickel transport system permease protein